MLQFPAIPRRDALHPLISHSPIEKKHNFDPSIFLSTIGEGLRIHGLSPLDLDLVDGEAGDRRGPLGRPRRHVPGQLVRDQAPQVRLVVEPAGKNTAPAIALATCLIERPDDEVMVVLPADHWIEREDVFAGVLTTAAERLATGSFGIDDPLVTLGIQPTFPSTDYGYLRPDTMRGELLGIRLHAGGRFRAERGTRGRDRGDA